jgi:hypothetical protein
MIKMLTGREEENENQKIRDWIYVLLSLPACSVRASEVFPKAPPHTYLIGPDFQFWSIWSGPDFNSGPYLQMMI